MDLFNVTAKDLSLFLNAQEAYLVHCAIGILCFSELAIWFYTAFGKKHDTRDTTLWFVIGAWCWGITAGIVFRDLDMPSWIRDLLYPHAVYYAGLALIVIGVIIRCAAVITLRHAFTHNVQTSDDQHLIQTGLYRLVRNPAYTGSIMSLIGVTLAYRSVVATLSVLVICAICYGVRIHIEETALKDHFGSEFTHYCQNVKYRLFPHIY